MVTSNSSRVRFIGQGPLPEFDYSQLPDNIRVEPPTIFTSKWRVVRSWLPCRERGTP